MGYNSHKNITKGLLMYKVTVKSQFLSTPKRTKQSKTAYSKKTDLLYALPIFLPTWAVVIKK